MLLYDSHGIVLSDNTILLTTVYSYSIVECSSYTRQKHLETSGNIGQSSCQDSELAEARRVLEEEKVRSQLWKLWMQIRRWQRLRRLLMWCDSCCNMLQHAATVDPSQSTIWRFLALLIGCPASWPLVAIQAVVSIDLWSGLLAVLRFSDAFWCLWHLHTSWSLSIFFF